MTIYKRLSVLTILVIALAACSDDSVKVQANFDNTQQFKVGTPVQFNDQVIGEVSDVELNAQGSQVTLSLNPATAAELSSSAAVVVNRLKQGAPLEVYNRESANATKLQDGQTIKGLDSMVQLGAWMVGDAIQLGRGSLSDYVQSFQDYLQSDDFAQDKTAVKQQFESAREQANTAIDGALEQLGSDIKNSAEQLAATEQAASQAIQELGDELAPMVGELAGDGARLSRELERFAASLEQQASSDQQAGEAFLASLLTTLEKLNQAIDDGVNASAVDAELEAESSPKAEPRAE